MPLMIAAMVSLIACGGNGGTPSSKTESTPQTPDNNPEVLAKTFAEYMQNKDYKSAVMLFARFSEKEYSLLEVHYKMEELNVGNFYSMSNSPAKIEIVDNNGNTCHIKTTVNVQGSLIDSDLYLKKVNNCWRIDEYKL